jgi:hypothetical protein
MLYLPQNQTDGNLGKDVVAFLVLRVPISIMHAGPRCGTRSFGDGSDGYCCCDYGGLLMSESDVTHHDVYPPPSPSLSSGAVISLSSLWFAPLFTREARQVLRGACRVASKFSRRLDRSFSVGSLRDTCAPEKWSTARRCARSGLSSLSRA